MRTAVYPGSFDPPTWGHLDIIRRVSGVFDEVVVCIMLNGAKSSGMFTTVERLELLLKLTEELPNVRVEMHRGLLADYVKQFDRPVIIRGLRAITDFEYEFQMALVNKKLNHEVETLFMVADDRYTYLSSSIVRELAKYKSELSCFVPPVVGEAIRKKLDCK